MVTALRARVVKARICELNDAFELSQLTISHRVKVLLGHLECYGQVDGREVVRRVILGMVIGIDTGNRRVTSVTGGTATATALSSREERGRLFR
jgi:hypothetical protein